MERLEDADVEDVVNAGAVRKLKAVGDVADAFQHLERPGIAWAQLPTRPGSQGLSGAVEEPQPDPRANVERQGSMMCVVVALGVGLRL